MTRTTTNPRLLSLTARGFAAIAIGLLAAGAAYGQSVTKVEAFSPPAAGVFCQNTTCWVTRGKSVHVRAYGNGITLATHVTDNSTNLASSLTGQKQVGLPGWVEVQLQPSASAPRGNVNVTVQQKVNNNVQASWSFSVFVIDNGTIQNASAPTPPGCFDEALLTVNGTNLGNARIRGIAGTSSVTRTSSTASQAQFRITWPTSIPAASIETVLCDEALPSSQGCSKLTVPTFGEVKHQITSPVATCATAGGTPPNPPALQGNIVQSTLYRIGSGTTVDNVGNNYVPLNPASNSPFCQGIAQPNPPYDANGAQRATRQTITVPPIQWSVRNNGGAMTGSTTARLMRNGQVVQTQTISGLASGQSTSPPFSYSRPNNSTCVARLGADGACYHCGTSGEGWNDNNVTVSFQ